MKSLMASIVYEPIEGYVRLCGRDEFAPKMSPSAKVIEHADIVLCRCHARGILTFSVDVTGPFIMTSEEFVLSTDYAQQVIAILESPSTQAWLRAVTGRSIISTSILLSIPV
jgi:hypothetical protein